MEYLGGGLPPSVEVAAGQRAPVVSVDDAIWVQHWDYLEDELVSHCYGLRAVGY